MLPDLLPVPPIVARVKPLANERNIVGHCMLLRVVRSCFAKFETDQTFEPTTPNISFVPWSPKRSAIMLDLFAQLFQHCWGPHSLQSLMGCILPTVHYRSQYCWELLHRLHTAANMGVRVNVSKNATRWQNQLSVVLRVQNTRTGNTLLTIPSCW